MNNRREFIKNIAISGAAITIINPSFKSFGNNPITKIRIGIIGVGSRGRLHMKELLKRADAEVTAIADPDLSSIEKAKIIANEMGVPTPLVFSQGDLDYRNLIKSDVVDAVIIATPWEWHMPQAIESMKAGKKVGLEVGGAIKLQDCWDLISAYEQTKTEIMILENVCYRRDVMAVLNMVQMDRFGELLHLQGGYQHDLRAQLFNTAANCCEGVGFGPDAIGSAKWRTAHYQNRNGEIYPTHQLGPIAMMLDINRGNRLTKLSSISSQARGMNRYVAKNPKGGPNHPNAKLKFNLGDIVTTQIQTYKGQTIVLTHDTSSPRPYNLGFRIQGTNGIWQDFHAGEPEMGQIYFEDTSPAETWENPKKYMEDYDHPLWKKHEQKAIGAGHGGMDYFVINAFIECVKAKQPFPHDVYDLATWYSITPLSEMSIKQGGQMVVIPDFTKGKWKTRVPFINIRDQFV